MFGSQQEKKQLAAEYYNQCTFEEQLKNQRLKEDTRRDKFETKKCDEHFMEQCQRARAEEIAKRELLRRVAEENLMLAANKKR
jgi:hypothetical protein